MVTGATAVVALRCDGGGGGGRGKNGDGGDGGGDAHGATAEAVAVVVGGRMVTGATAVVVVTRSGLQRTCS